MLQIALPDLAEFTPAMGASNFIMFQSASSHSLNGEKRDSNIRNYNLQECNLRVSYFIEVGNCEDNVFAATAID